MVSASPPLFWARFGSIVFLAFSFFSREGPFFAPFFVSLFLFFERGCVFPSRRRFPFHVLRECCFFRACLRFSFHFVRKGCVFRASLSFRFRFVREGLRVSRAFSFQFRFFSRGVAFFARRSRSDFVFCERGCVFRASLFVPIPFFVRKVRFLAHPLRPDFVFFFARKVTFSARPFRSDFPFLKPLPVPCEEWQGKQEKIEPYIETQWDVGYVPI